MNMLSTYRRHLLSSVSQRTLILCMLAIESHAKWKPRLVVRTPARVEYDFTGDQ